MPIATPRALVKPPIDFQLYHGYNRGHVTSGFGCG